MQSAIRTLPRQSRIEHVAVRTSVSCADRAVNVPGILGPQHLSPAVATRFRPNQCIGRIGRHPSCGCNSLATGRDRRRTSPRTSRHDGGVPSANLHRRRCIRPVLNSAVNESLHLPGVLECSATRGIVEDAPHVGRRRDPGYRLGKRVDARCVVLRPIFARRSVEPVIDEPAPSAWRIRSGRRWRVGRDPSDLESNEECLPRG